MSASSSCLPVGRVGGVGERRRTHIAELSKRAAESDARLKRLYDAIEVGVADINDPALKDRLASLAATCEQAQADAVRVQAMLKSSGAKAITPHMVRIFANAARQRIRNDDGAYRRDHLRALAQRVEVAEGEVRIIGSKSWLHQTLTANGGANRAPTQGLKWRKRWDSNPRWSRPHGGFQDRCLKPLGHPSGEFAETPRFSRATQEGRQLPCSRRGERLGGD
jgi:site-specific DNA recombinase